jgi:hypothetical protein
VQDGKAVQVCTFMYGLLNASTKATGSYIGLSYQKHMDKAGSLLPKARDLTYQKHVDK